MRFTNNYNLNLPDLADQFNIDHWNENTTGIDDLIKTRENEFNAHNSNLENPHQVKGSQLVEPVPTEKIADLSIVTDKIADKNVTMEKLAQVVQECLSPVGTIRTGLWKTAPNGWLLCNGEKVLISDYPKLYQCAVDNGWLKQDSDTTRFYLPDYRETVLVGVGENTTDTITSHDVYELGEFKDDQLQGHWHNVRVDNASVDILNAGSTIDSSGHAGLSYMNTTEFGDIRAREIISDGTNGTSRKGTTTHGKQKGVNYIIKY